jgi:hypothetical protein
MRFIFKFRRWLKHVSITAETSAHDNGDFFRYMYYNFSHIIRHAMPKLNEFHLDGYMARCRFWTDFGMSWPRHLKTLRIINRLDCVFRQESAICETQVSIPTDLETLELSSEYSNAFTLRLPSSFIYSKLRVLKIGGCYGGLDVSDLRLLPPTLRTLELNVTFLSNTALRSLPSQITKLVLVIGYLKDPHFTLECLDMLPASLERLRFEGFAKSTIFSDLPPGLQSFTWNPKGIPKRKLMENRTMVYPHNLPTHVIANQSFFKKLPASLKSLKLYAMSLETNQDLIDLPKKLAKLWIETSQCEELHVPYRIPNLRILPNLQAE